MKNVIYKATCKTTGKCYVGQTAREFDIRKAEHIQAGQKKSNNPFHNAILEYGADDFVWSVLESLPDETDLLKREVYWSYQEHAYVPEGYSPLPGNISSTSCKPVICLETGDIFEKASDAGLWCGLRGGITEALKTGCGAGFIPGTTQRAHFDYLNPVHKERMKQKMAKKNGSAPVQGTSAPVSTGMEAVLIKQIDFLQSQVEYLQSRLAMYEK